MASRAVCAAWITGLVALGAHPASAQDIPRVEITPFVAVGTSGASPLGVMTTFPITASLRAETELGYRHDSRGPDHLSFSTTVLQFLPRVGRAAPYVAVGAGLSQYTAPVLNLRGTPIGTERRLSWTVNAGGGFTVPLSRNLALRTDARYFDSLGQGQDQFRVAHGLSFGVGQPRK